MRVILEPTVTTFSKQIFIEHPVYKIPADGNDAVKIGAFAAKGCYDSFGENGRANEENQRQVIEHVHGSVLEHIQVGVFIEGVTRGLSLESNRHRQNAISQRSTRYTAEEDAAIVLEPYYAELWRKYVTLAQITRVPATDTHPGRWTYRYSDTVTTLVPDLKLLINFLNSAERSFMDYNEQVCILMSLNPNDLKGFDLRKWARGKARNILPHALETRVAYTGNLRSWRWFIQSRSENHAEPEIRRLADKLLAELRIHYPLYFEDFENIGDFDGIPEWVPKYRKV